MLSYSSSSVASRRPTWSNLKKNESYERELQERAVRQKRLAAIVEDALLRVRSQIASRLPPVHSHLFFGAMGIHPKHLVTWYLFRTNSDREAAKQSGLTSEIESATRKELAAGGYSQDGLDLMKVAFTSDEDIQNKAGGNLWLYFK